MLSGVLPIGSRQRVAAVAAVFAAALLLFTQLVLPGSGGHRGTPGAILFFGLTAGLVSSLTAVGIILIYRTNRIINFAQSGIGAAGAVFTYNCITALHWPFVAAFAVGVAVGAGVGALVDIVVVKRFFNAPRLLLTALTIALLAALGQFAVTIASFPIFGPADRTAAQRLGTEQVKLPFKSFSFHIGTVALNFGFKEVFSIAICLLSLAGVAFFLYRTRIGIAVRAASENTDRASLLGIPIKLMSTIVWAVAGAIAAIGLITLGMITDFTTSAGGGTTTLIRALAAAVLARMKSIPVAIVAAVGIEIATQAVKWSYPSRVELVDLGLLIVIVAGLLFQSRERVRGDEGESGSWQSVEEFRPMPKELNGIRGLRIARWVLGGALLAFVLVVPWVLSTGGTVEAGRIIIYTIVLLSLVVLTGWAGLISLGQFGFVAIGAVVGGALSARLGVPFWFAVPAAAVFASLFSVVLGLTALRIRGFYLGVVTLAFAGAVDAILFKKQYFGWLLPDRVDRPTAFFVDFNDERSMYYLLVVALMISIAIVAVLRKTRTGRVTIGMRENEPNVQSFGVNIVRTRLQAFALSGFLAGFAGALFVHHQRAIDPSSYSALLSLNFFVLAVVAGVGAVSGAIVGGLYAALQTVLTGVSGPIALILGLVFGPIGLLFLLYIFPRGLTSMLYSLRDAILRIVAQRRQLIVPSLFADYDPRAVERQLVPLSQADPKLGLGNLAPDLRYRKESVLHGTGMDEERGGRDEDARALRAAVDAVGEGS